ncbi:tannase/feruloyl esterase family alpha/beta hydrolase [Variovorax paradoxus]|uniref:Tannase/feruloyl esterase family alpha/beta hydrolase n=1 Tax=Variovorax paradoxus TaxID=34073 RepID=A0A5Q0M4A7_VARPD|nr:tannase/feruloyl esterase family alpha/beta hydrolase [Variovorax paradoxus]QFZ84068.1 tannase/feruloyl esterase family alpha/beta hydrolase [Variovorax paradoxus]
MIDSRPNLLSKRMCTAVALSFTLVLAACGGGNNGGASLPFVFPVGDSGVSGSNGSGGDTGTDPNALPSVDALKATCTSIVGKTFASATVTAANRIEGDASLGTTGMCQVLATRAPYLDIEVVVPDNWSGRYYQQGGGGFDGRIRSAFTKDNSGAITEVTYAITKQAAVYASSNGGNRAGVAGQAAPAVFFDGTEAGKQSMADYSYASLGSTLYFAKAVIREFFKQDAKYRYFVGCSNGGRNAAIAVQRWPEEFDGAVSGCYGFSMPGQTVAWTSMAGLAGTPVMPSGAQWSAVYKAAVASCDAADNLADGVISNPSRCTFDPSTQVCGQPLASTDPAVCLTPAQLPTVQKLFAGGWADATGNTIYSPYGWANANPASFGGLGGGYVAMATNDASWLTAAKQATFDVNVDYGPVTAGLQLVGSDVDKIALAKFIASGKKFLTYHDGADGLLSVNEHTRIINNVYSIAKSMGLADPSTSSRYFVVPGTGHGGSQALTQVRWDDAIVKWVEAGAAPTQLTFNSKTSTGAAKSIPVCQYPQYPRYVPGGDVNSDASYTCTAP